MLAVFSLIYQVKWFTFVRNIKCREISLITYVAITVQHYFIMKSATFSRHILHHIFRFNFPGICGIQFRRISDTTSQNGEFWGTYSITTHHAANLGVIIYFHRRKGQNFFQNIKSQGVHPPSPYFCKINAFKEGFKGPSHGFLF